MDDPSLKLPGLGNLKWYSLMGYVGLALFAASIVIEMNIDNKTAMAVGLMLMGWGFGNAECRTFKQQIGRGFKVTAPVWQWTISGVLLFTCSACAAGYLVFTLFA